jgi:HPt (histidine-containing phosphotransfer) domain-containing protein
MSIQRLSTGESAVAARGNKSTPKRHLDLESALRRLEGDTALLAEIIVMFLRDYPEMVEHIRSAIDRQDAAALRRSAHKLKGCIGYFGAEDVVQLAYRLECMGEACKLDRAGDCFKDLLAALDELVKTLREKSA